MANYPEGGEFVIANINKIMPYGAFCTLQEYGNLEAFLHVSEVSSGWVKNIRDYVKEGQKIVAVVQRVDLDKHQIDLSLKRVSESDRKRKMESYQLGKRAEKLLERAGGKLKKNLKDAYKEVGDTLIAEYGDLYSSFERIKAGEVSPKIPNDWLAVLREIAEVEIKEKVIEARAELRMQSYEEEGILIIRGVLEKISKCAPGLEVQYIGAPAYYIDFKVKEHKDVDKTIAKIEKVLSGVKGIEYTLQKTKG